MNRRNFIVGAGLALFTGPVAAVAQQPKHLWRIGYLSPSAPADSARVLIALQQGLKELGYADQDIMIEARYAEGKLERLPELAAALVGLPVDALIPLATPAALAAKKMTTITPIIVVAVGDPVGVGLVKSLAHPGGNITGLTLNNLEVAAKRLQLLKEVAPKISRVAVLANAANPAFAAIQLRATDLAAQALSVQLQSVMVKGQEDFEPAFDEMRKARAEGLVLLPDPMFDTYRVRLAQLALRRRLASTHDFRSYVEAGGLIAYYTDVEALYRRAAVYIDKILKGAKPADLPVEQPTTFRLAINLKTAKALALTIPQSLLLRADEVIQ
jgi:putative tryptophan/tyrosine transport system substrate-binding protein